MKQRAPLSLSQLDAARARRGLKALGPPHALQVFFFCSGRPGGPVGEIQEAVEISAPTLSHHLPRSGGPGSSRVARKSGTSITPSGGHRDRSGPAASPPAAEEESMGAKVHIHMHVSDLGPEPRVLSRLLRSAPVKEKPATRSSCPNGAGQPGAVPGRGTRHGAGESSGRSAGNTAEVMSQLERIKAAGLPVREEMASMLPRQPGQVLVGGSRWRRVGGLSPQLRSRG